VLQVITVGKKTEINKLTNKNFTFRKMQIQESCHNVLHSLLATRHPSKHQNDEIMKRLGKTRPMANTAIFVDNNLEIACFNLKEVGHDKQFSICTTL